MNTSEFYLEIIGNQDTHYILPSELFDEILSFLQPFPFFLRMRRVCRAWLSHIDAVLLPKVRCLDFVADHFSSPEERRRCKVKSFVEAVEHRLNGMPDAHDAAYFAFMSRLTRKFSSVESVAIRLDDKIIRPSVLCFILRSFQQLKSITLYSRLVPSEQAELVRAIAQSFLAAGLQNRVLDCLILVHPLVYHESCWESLKPLPVQIELLYANGEGLLDKRLFDEPRLSITTAPDGREVLFRQYLDFLLEKVGIEPNVLQKFLGCDIFDAVLGKFMFDGCRALISRGVKPQSTRAFELAWKLDATLAMELLESTSDAAPMKRFYSDLLRDIASNSLDEQALAARLDKHIRNFVVLSVPLRQAIRCNNLRVVQILFELYPALFRQPEIEDIIFDVPVCDASLQLLEFLVDECHMPLQAMKVVRSTLLSGVMTMRQERKSATSIQEQELARLLDERGAAGQVAITTISFVQHLGAQAMRTDQPYRSLFEYVFQSGTFSQEQFQQEIKLSSLFEMSILATSSFKDNSAYPALRERFLSLEQLVYRLVGSSPQTALEDENQNPSLQQIFSKIVLMDS